MQCNGHLRTKLPRRRKVKDNEARPVREEKYDSTRVNTGGADRAYEQCVSQPNSLL
jgi:hypothetical protein